MREENLARAITLYKGALLPGFIEEGFVSERERLAEAYLNALGDLADVLAQRGDRAGALEYARRAVATDLLREDSHCRLMRLYAQGGRSAEALRQYVELERVLHDQMGTTPGEEARTLASTIRNGGGAIPATAAQTKREPADPPVAAAAPSLPTGTVTFLLTDIEGSTRLWEQHPRPMTRALARHDVLVAEIVATAQRLGGQEPR
jgi:DNA-binding SARP family transcriptional activator